MARWLIDEEGAGGVRIFESTFWPRQMLTLAKTDAHDGQDRCS